MTKLQFLRRQRNLKATVVAEALGIDGSVLSRLECGWFARCPDGLEERLQDYYGEGWTFKTLMEDVEAIAPK